MDLYNVYFVTGTSYAGKSTLVRNLADRHGGIALGENYHNAKLPGLDRREFPNLTYTRDLRDWHDFIRRTPEEYVRWLKDVTKECETVELRILRELLADPATGDRKIFADTNISIKTLRSISDTGHVLVMLADPETAIRRFFDRPDPEKQFLYRLMLEEPDPQAALDNYREILKRVCTRESYDEYLHSGFRVILRDESRSPEETAELAEKLLGIAAPEDERTKGTVLQTQRLILRFFREEDARALYENHLDGEVRRWFPNECYADPEEARGAARFYAECARKGRLPFVLAAELKETGELIGDAGISALEGSGGEAEAGYCIGGKYRRQGYASELLEAVCGFAASRFGIGTLWGRVVRGNTASVRVLEKCGFSFVREEHGAQDDPRGLGMLVYEKTL